MSRIFFSQTDTERKRKKRAAKRNQALITAIQTDDDSDSNNKLDVDTSTYSPPIVTSPLINTNDVDNSFVQQPNIMVDPCLSDDFGIDVEDLVRSTDANHQRKIYLHSHVSIYEACQTIIKLSRRLNLDKNKMKILLDGIRSLLPNDNKLPRTTVGLMKILQIDNRKKVAYYCVECLTRLHTPQQTHCSSNCSLNNIYRSFSNVSELTVNDIESEIRSKIERYANVIIEYPNRSKSLLPCDTPNGDIYETLSSSTSIKCNQKQVTVLLHIDGAPVTKFGGKSLWPIQATLCEIPPPLRDHKKAVMVFGAWLSSRHPDIRLLWTKVVDQLQQVFRDKIIVKINRRSVEFVVRIQLITFDLPALALNCNIIQFNGYYACPFCIAPGKLIDKQVFYPYSQTSYVSKTADDYQRFGSDVSSTTTLGIKGPTPLTNVLLFPCQIAIDFMHLSCSGHVKTLIGYWHKMLLPRVFQEASDYLTSIILPHNFNHQLMPLLDYSNWKTKYFRDFLIYISPVFCILFLPDKYALHFLNYFVYVRALYHYETKSEIDNIDVFFDEYYSNLSSLYGEKSHLFTVHVHCHLKEQVIRHGALSMTSCFPRESYLGFALNMCHGKKYILEQFSSWYLIDRSLSENNTIEVDDVFLIEQLNDRYLNTEMISTYKPKLMECLTKQNILNDRTIHIQYYGRYRRGFKSFHSMVYSRAGRAISYQVSLVNPKCMHKKTKCFSDVIFYFKLIDSTYAFVRQYPCINGSLANGLTTVVVPQNLRERLDVYYGLFDQNQYAYKVVPVTDLVNKVIKMRWSEENIFVFTDVVVDWEDN